jgi:hypothetical protein
MKVVSVNVGLPREVVWKGRRVTTGIFKQPVEGAVRVGKLNLDGDQQADLTVHGGPDKAVYAYPAEHYEPWKRELPPYRISLHPNGGIRLPTLEVPSMTGMLTDLNTFFVAISPRVGIEKVNKIGESYVNPTLLYGDWSNAGTTSLGQDCTQLKITLSALSTGLVTFQSDFLPPSENNMKFNKNWMIPPVTPGTANNFQMLKSNPDGTLSALWGNERYTVITKIDRSSGRILSAIMENDLKLKMRNGCDRELDSCGAELPVVMHRDVLLESIETGTLNQKWSHRRSRALLQLF